ncbi:MAG: hypothetical protein ACQESR_15380 [Planctomycetota bacterium]
MSMLYAWKGYPVIHLPPPTTKSCGREVIHFFRPQSVVCGVSNACRTGYAPNLHGHEQVPGRDARDAYAHEHVPAICSCLREAFPATNHYMMLSVDRSG